MKSRKVPDAVYKICIYCKVEWNVSVKDKYEYYICPVCRSMEKQKIRRS